MVYSSEIDSFESLKEFLDYQVKTYHTPDFLPEDPLGIVHEFSLKQDQEIMGLFMATIAWGNRKSILKSGRRLIEIFKGKPYEFVLNHQSQDFENIEFVHRTFQKSDLQFFCEALKSVYTEHSSLESVFSIHSEISGIKGRIVNFRNTFLAFPHEKRSEKHLANPLKNSAAKRINMFLRWMVRQDDQKVDLGIWTSISPAELYIPLDVHTSTVGRKLGLITRKQDDWKALDELMSNLREFDAKDPSKYDFALFSLGVNKTLD